MTTEFAIIVIVAAAIVILASGLIIIPAQNAAALVREASGIRLRVPGVAVDLGSSGLSVDIGRAATPEQK
jgi:uncharacterized membrane protein YqiK